MTASSPSILNGDFVCATMAERSAANVDTAEPSQDVPEGVALEIEGRADLANEDVASTLDGFMDRFRRNDHQLTLRLASS